MCNCRSYNRPELGGSMAETPVRYRDFFPHSQKEFVCLDTCIVEQVKAVWAAGIETGGCCCGHNHAVTPQLFVRFPKDVERACQVLAETDSRDWNVLVWSKSGQPQPRMDQ
ncbi:hypothetical protein MXMO3_01813 [Maritalea myrionectae]|uniref:Uncharacterized protein n=1 Tax=Maritalea myrionectae TaxID=454601 RepID=A0A2R4ME72_9HYPH|nr:hypothetical protein MXMO3_01813 [Maritalea myrionectae]